MIHDDDVGKVLYEEQRRKLAIRRRATMPPMQLTGAIVRAGKMDKTVTMAVAKDVYLSKLQKTVVKHKKYLIHDEQNQLLVGDHVIAEACPPISARKRFRFVELVGGVEAGAARRLRSQQLMAAEERERVRIEGIVRAERQAAAAGTSRPESSQRKGKTESRRRSVSGAGQKTVSEHLAAREGKARADAGAATSSGQA